MMANREFRYACVGRGEKTPFENEHVNEPKWWYKVSSIDRAYYTTLWTPIPTIKNHGKQGLAWRA